MNKNPFPKTVWGCYWLVIKKFPVYYGVIFVCGILNNVMSMIFDPLASKWTMQIFENALDTSWASVLYIFLLLGGMFLFTLSLNLLRSILRGRKQQIFNRYKLYLLYKRVYENDMSFFLDKPSGQIMSQSQEVSVQMERLTQEFWTEIIGCALGFLFIVGSMFAMNVWFVVLLMSYGVIKVIWQWSIQKKIKENNKLEMEESSKYSGLRSDSLNNALTVKYFANNNYENMYIYKGRDNLIQLIKQGYFLDRLQYIPTSVLWVLVRLILIAMCFVLIKQNGLSIANAAFVISAAYSINTSFNRINDSLRRYSTMSARAIKAYNNVIAPIKVTDQEHAKNLKIKQATIDFDRVSFAYGKNHVFNNFDLHVDNAEKIGVVGLSGAGKTTLCNLLLRMYDVDNGAVKINDIDIRDITQDSLRKNISFVPQEATLFNRTIMENIRYAKPTATKNEVINAAKKAHIHEFISKLPKGYNTLVGNNGIKLSGGQRQRISIARALLKNAPILILDEATSALDSQNELMIQKSLQNAMRGKTTLVIAHRLSTLRNMDKIVVIKHGKIIETGSHKQLLRKNGAYKKLWELQTSGFVS